MTALLHLKSLVPFAAEWWYTFPGIIIILTINEYSSAMAEDNVLIEFIRFEYDVEKAAKAVESSPLPDELADRLRKAF